MGEFQAKSGDNFQRNRIVRAHVRACHVTATKVLWSSLGAMTAKRYKFLGNGIEAGHQNDGQRRAWEI